MEYKIKYIRKKLMRSDEISFFETLKAGLIGLNIFPQVSMNAVLDIQNQKSWTQRQHFWAKIIDYVVCTNSCEIIAIIELDGHSHDTQEKKEKDEKRDSMLREAGYIVLRYDKRKPVEPAILNNDFRKIIAAWHIIKLREKMEKDEKNILKALSDE